MPNPTKKSQPIGCGKLKLGVSLELLGLISRAAVLEGKTRTTFVREAAQRAAIAVLAERTLFAVDADTYVKFAAALDCPPRPNEKLVRAMQTPAPWDGGSVHPCSSF